METRLISLIALALAISSLNRIETCLWALAVALPLALLAKLPLKAWLALAHANTFTLWLWVTLPLSTPGEAIAFLGPWPISRNGVMISLAITLKINAIACLGLAMMFKADPIALGRAVGRVFFSPKLGWMLYWAHKSTADLLLRGQRLRLAANMRGFTPRLNLFTLRHYANLWLMVLLTAMKKAEISAQAMAMRGFEGRFPSPIQPPKALNHLIGPLSAALILAFFWLERA